MSKITEITSFTIPPCSIDKDLIKKVGEVLEREYEIFYKEVFEEVKKNLQENSYYKSYPERLTDEEIKSKIYGTNLSYSLASTSRNIESAKIDAFVQAEWPDSADEIVLGFGSSSSRKKISISIYLPRWRMDRSQVTISGDNSTWVNGIAVELGRLFEGRKFSYYPLVTKSGVRVFLSVIAWVSLSFAIVFPIWPHISSFFKESTTFVLFYSLVAILGALIAIWPMEEFLSWLFPRFEYGKKSTSRKLRGYFWALLVSSGFISTLILKLLGF